MATQPPSDNGFDFIAPVYDTLSRLVFGNSLRKAQVYWLDQVPKGTHLLLFGGGSGWLLSRILAVCEPQKVIYIDASPVMISLARKKVGSDHRVDFRIGTETAIQTNDRVDVLFTPFILDLFTDNRLKNVVLPRLLGCLRTSGFWFSSDFVEPTTWWQRLLLWSQYRFFRTLSHIEARQLPNWMPLLNRLPSISQGELQSFFGGMIVSGYWQKGAPTKLERVV